MSSLEGYREVIIEMMRYGEAVDQIADKINCSEEDLVEYIKSVTALEDAMEPFKEQKRELKADFKENGWLTGEEISLTVKAYRMMKAEVDMDQFLSIYEGLMTRTGRAQ